MGKKGGAVLGRNLARSQQRTGKVARSERQEGYLHTTDLQDGYDWGRLNLQSVTEEDSFTDFLNTAELAGREFDAEKWNVKLLDAQTRQIYIDTNKAGEFRELTEEERVMPIPRRPDWRGLTPEQLKEAENQNFLEWRRRLAATQEETDCVVTPYEKNLEFWRQLWRVIERSDLVVQIVDCRHPLMFRSPDLEKYVKEVSPLKQNLLLVNKSDFLTLEQRKAWAEYFNKENIKFAFFSAITEDEEGDAVQTPGSVSEEETEETDEKNEEMSELTVLSSSQLLQLFRSYKRHEIESITVGCIGYPNVGKSSTINKLLSSKKVRVSETPGKTKHFQTLTLTEDITLCDCPGLVMPSIANSKAGMVLQGILPIDQLRDHVPVVSLLVSRIPAHVMEAKYGLVLPRGSEVTSERLLTAYGTLRGFMTAGGRPDQARGARIILKDYVGGKLLYCEAPPGVEQEEFHQFEVETRRVWKAESHQETEARRLQHQVNRTKQEEIDSNFFSGMSMGAHVKSKKKLEGRLSDKNKRKGKAKKIYAELDPKRHDSTSVVMLIEQVEKELRKEVYKDNDSDSSDEEDSEGLDTSEESEDSDDDGLLDEVVSELRQQVESSMSLSDKDKSVLKFLDQRKELTGQGLVSPSPEVKGGERQVTLEELTEHGKREDAWIAVNGSVYNVTQYLDLHPGGWDEIIKGVGRDATDLFNEKHQWVDHQEILDGKLVGTLVKGPSQV